MHVRRREGDQCQRAEGARRGRVQEIVVAVRVGGGLRALAGRPDDVINLGAEFVDGRLEQGLDVGELGVEVCDVSLDGVDHARVGGRCCGFELRGRGLQFFSRRGADDDVCAWEVGES